jgi:hypothetical protein
VQGGKEENDVEFHGSERNDVDSSLARPIIERRWGAVLPGLKALKLKLGGEKPGEEMEGNVYGTDTWSRRHKTFGKKGEVQGDTPRVVSIRMLRKYKTHAFPDERVDPTSDINTLTPCTNIWPTTCLDTSNILG